VEDAAETAGGILVMVGAVQRNTKASSAGTTGDNATLNVDANGGLWLASDVVEDAAETAAAPLTGVGTVRRDTPASSAGTTGDNATLNTDANGKLWTSETYIEDAAETAGGGLAMAGTVRRDTLASSAGTTGDNATLNTDALGALYVTPTGHGTFVSGTISVTTAGTSVQGGSNTTKQCYFGAAPSNTGNCFLGAATGDNRNKGLVLIKSYPSIGPISMTNTNLAWADCANNGDVVTFFCTN
jgi:hypothetical protein